MTDIPAHFRQLTYLEKTDTAWSTSSKFQKIGLWHCNYDIW